MGIDESKTLILPELRQRGEVWKPRRNLKISKKYNLKILLLLSDGYAFFGFYFGQTQVTIYVENALENKVARTDNIIQKFKHRCFTSGCMVGMIIQLS